MDRRSTANRTILSVERLDERIAPSHGQSEAASEPHGLALGHLKRESEVEPQTVTNVVATVVNDAVDLVAKTSKGVEHGGHGTGGKGDTGSGSGSTGGSTV